MAPADVPAVSDAEMAAFRAAVLREGARHRRRLPWRWIDDDYAVLVSEVMLQQTQVKRVLRYWGRFMALFPTLDALAAADTPLVLELWQGLGYNRRALMLKRCAEECASRYGGSLPDGRDELLALPGIGPATAGGILAFARGRRCVYLETNVRGVFLHHFFPDAQKVPDTALVPLVERACPDEGVRDWYYALLDYGAHLKAAGANPTRRSASYARQSAFEGSRRQKRAVLVRAVLGSGGGGVDGVQLKRALDGSELAAGRPPVDDDLFAAIVADLVAEGFFRLEGGRYRA